MRCISCSTLASKTIQASLLAVCTLTVNAADLLPMNENQAGAWQFSGLMEVELSAGHDFSGDSLSDIAVATIELAAETRVNPWIGISLSVLFEEDDTEPPELDTALLSLGNSAESSYSFVAGRTYVPFGTFESHMISDPLTLELGETRETILSANYDQGGIVASAYLFNGDVEKHASNDDTVRQFGLSLGYLFESSSMVLDTSLGYISNLADSDAISAAITTPGAIDDAIPGMSAGLTYNRGPWVFIVEYVAALSRFESADLDYATGGAKPSAYNIELAHAFEWSAREYTLAYSIQGSDEALRLKLPESRLLFSLSTRVYDNLDVNVEWRRDEDYATSVGGAGNIANVLALQAAVSF